MPGAAAVGWGEHRSDPDGPGAGDRAGDGRQGVARRGRAGGRGRPWRTFIAVRPPSNVGVQLASAARRIDDPVVRIVAPESIHLTLVFIGDIEPAAIDGIAESMARAAAGIAPFDVVPERFARLPDAASPRLIAAVAACPSPLAELQRRLAARLVAPRRFRRPYLPHLTVARWPGRGGASSGPAAAADLPPMPPYVRFTVDHVVLMRSHLRPGGAEHEVLVRTELPPAG